MVKGNFVPFSSMWKLFARDNVIDTYTRAKNIDMWENFFSLRPLVCEKKLCHFIIMWEKFITTRETKP